MKRPIVLAAAATALILPLAACASSDPQDTAPQYQGVCMSQDGQNRVDDDYCDPDDDEYQGGMGWAWVFLAMNSRVPAVGSSLRGTNYTPVRPAKPYVLGGAPVRGGTITRSTMAAGASPYVPVSPSAKPSIKNPSSTATPKSSTAPPAKPQVSATPKPAAPSAAAPAAPAAPKASKKPWWTGMSSKACGKMSRSSGGSKSYSSGGGSKSWGSSGNKSTSKGSSGTTSGSSSSKKSC